ncbi:glycosyltransferase family 2 protein [Azospirillum doebereinerae]
MTVKPCAVVPSRNHHKVLGAILATLRGRGLPVIVVDDGSDEPARSAIAAFHDPGNGVQVLRLPTNGGKGAAVIAGLRLAAAQGYSHAVQVDADGQHDLGALDSLLDTAAAHPEALVSGRPLYDQSVPRARRIGRWLTHVWVWVETLSLRIADSMCGFRVYPVTATLDVADREPIGRRMDFDTEIMVRLFWRGVPVLHVPVRVAYPAGNTSNFRMLRDNWLLTVMHTRLCLTLLWRLPGILRNRPPAVASEGSRHWASLGERGAYLGMRLAKLIYTAFGRSGCRTLLGVVVTYFYLTDSKGRRSSLDYLARVNARSGRPPPRWRDGLRHYMSFADKALNVFIAWSAPERTGPMTVEGDADLDRLTAEGKGVLLIVSHLGNAELCRARLAEQFRKSMNVLLHTRHAVQYNRLLRSIRPDVADHTIQVTEIGPETAIALKDRIERGEWIAIAGDRTPVGGQTRTSRVPFLGEDAPFSQGPYVLAALMGCPVYLMFCLREGDGHRVHFEKFADRVELPRRNKDVALTELAARYAARLEHHCLKAPLQWFNFFDFWAPSPPEKAPPAAS